MGNFCCVERVKEEKFLIVDDKYLTSILYPTNVEFDCI